MNRTEHARLAQRIQAIESSPSDRLDDLVHAAGIDPLTDLRYGDWHGFDLSGAELRGFNLTGADLSGAIFDNAHIAGAIFDRATYDLASLRRAADFDAFFKQECCRPAASQRLPPDRRLREFSILRDTPLCPELVVMPSGEFLMGSDESEAQLTEVDKAWSDEIVAGQGKRLMRIVRRFALGRYPVTFEEYELFLMSSQEKRKRSTGEATDPHNWGRGRYPVINVSWNDARAYCDWLNERTGLPKEFGYRLPSEAEWEYACRAGTTTLRWWGDEWDPAYANGIISYDGGKTNPVNHYKPNLWGLHDMIGNIWEWCADQFADNILKLPLDGIPNTLSRQKAYTIRGGSYDAVPRNLRCAIRNRNFFDARDITLGFRVARTLMDVPGRVSQLIPLETILKPEVSRQRPQIATPLPREGEYQLVQIVESITYALQSTADWRRNKAQEFPDDERNAETAIFLDQLAQELQDLDRRELQRIADVTNFQGSTDAELIYSSEAVSAATRDVGFRWFPRNGSEFLATVLRDFEREVVRSNVETDVETREDRIRESRLRRACQKADLRLLKSRKRASSDHPYHIIEPLKNMHMSYQYSDGMTLEQAEEFMANQK
jgi:formylglycine-generating enzyme required for sulfatase activity